MIFCKYVWWCYVINFTLLYLTFLKVCLKMIFIVNAIAELLLSFLCVSLNCQHHAHNKYLRICLPFHINSRCQSFTARRGPVAIGASRPSSEACGFNWRCQFIAARRGTVAHLADLARSITARSITECAARHSNASRYNRQGHSSLIIWSITFTGPRSACIIPPNLYVNQHKSLDPQVK